MATRGQFYESALKLRLANDPLAKLGLQWRACDELPKYYEAYVWGQVPEANTDRFGMDAPLKAGMMYVNGYRIDLIWGADIIFGNGTLGYQLMVSATEGRLPMYRAFRDTVPDERGWFRNLNHLEVLLIVTEVQQLNGGSASRQSVVDAATQERVNEIKNHVAHTGPRVRGLDV